ncbi:ring canal kelch homolog isoform X1 [Acyrthosiphon pisum]|uniref:Kelch-like protein diablo n=2 Tax=Acyrthosiphon pisum TaxID=7029 RepID=A0A8R2H4P7_ACYPI|nr:ring canal kelch homolog isoform X1 [Acyrthosiphon pisum]XP_003243238.1 ring canal kelch homolog isoform X1 [Acyrthosiphon pisum]XP_016658370.1 ring canal kelch homolog isoform X1 [Acyrthosiphon pisum]|eukprot:XP_001949058.2 PREDICTED: ring canal kelch homolog isoform X1 [Acyrthosiphon pisum]
MQNKRQKLESSRGETCKISSYTETFEVLQTLRKDGFFCDVKLKTDDNKIIIAHKVVLASASPYFYAMFTKFSEKNTELVVMREIDSTALQMLVNFIYSGAIEVTKENVQILLQAANILQLQEVKDVCCDLLESQLCPKNCIGINATADTYDCTKLITSSELYIQQHFSEVVGGDEFLSLSSEQVVKLISSDKIIVPSEEEVFESVIRWVKHELGSRKCILPQLMEHVRLPLTSKNYILNKVVEEPLIKNCLKCKDYISEALNCHIFNSELIPQNIRNKPRHGDKVLLSIGGVDIELRNRTKWYDPKTEQWHFGPELLTIRHRGCAAVVNDNLVFTVGGSAEYCDTLRSVEVLDLSSESLCWRPSVEMLVERDALGVGVINNDIYAVGGWNIFDDSLSNAEVFDIHTQEWRMISSMSTARSYHGVGVLNNILFAVGGHNKLSQALDTVECYDPSLDTWTPVAKMSVCRDGVGAGVLDGVLYAVGGKDGSKALSSVEAYRPSTGVWSTIADMHKPRRQAGVVALNGLLYVIGGLDDTFFVHSIEFYSPETNSWTIVAASTEFLHTSAGVAAINRHRNFKSQ